MFNSLKAFLHPNNRPEGYVYSSSKWVTILMVIGILLYTITDGWGTLVALSLAVALLIGRYMLAKQAAGDFLDMHQAKKGYAKTRNKDYLRFIKARGEQMLNDNKVLTKAAKEEIHQLLAYAEKYL